MVMLVIIIITTKSLASKQVLTRAPEPPALKSKEPLVVFLVFGGGDGDGVEWLMVGYGWWVATKSCVVFCCYAVVSSVVVILLCSTSTSQPPS
jgi:hypothetical protein